MSRHPACAIAWSLWCRHRWGFVASLATLLVMAVVYPILFSYTRDYPVLVLSTLPLLGVFGFVLNAVLFVEEVGSLSSSYPRSMLVLPVPTRTLVLWPLLYASGAAALLWLATALLIYRPSGFQVAVFPHSLALASLMTWIVAVSWLPIDMAWLRVFLVIGSTLAMGALAAWLHATVRASAGFIVLLLVCYMVAACILGLSAVASARRGDAWCAWAETGPSALVKRTPAAKHRRRPFRSPAAAQFWYEWKCHGLVLPYFVTFVWLVVTIIRLSFESRANPYALPVALATFLGMPIVLASCVGTTSGGLRPFWVKARGFITFTAVRPMHSGDLVAAKFRMLLASVLLTWLIVLAGTGLWVLASRNTQNVMDLLRGYLNLHRGGQMVALLLSAAVLLPAWTWKHASDGVAPLLTGRRWIADGLAFLSAGILLAVLSAGLRFYLHPAEFAVFLSFLPWLVVGAAVIKGGVAVTCYVLALKRQLIKWPSLLKSVGSWLLLNACAIATVHLALARDPLPVSRPVIFLGIATLTPLARLPLATLALEWNRHR